MRFRARYAAWLLPLFLTACAPPHKPQPTPYELLAPRIASLPKPPTSHVELADDTLDIPLEPLQTDEDVDEEPLAPVHRHHLPHPVEQAVVPPPPPDNPVVSALGQLSSGDASDLHRQLGETIAATERSLNSIGRSLSGSEQKTAAQIRSYLKQASEALNTGDVDGAHILVVKAKLLLDELTQ